MSDNMGEVSRMISPARKVLGLLLLSFSAVAAVASPPPTSVIVEKAKTKRIADSLEALGTLRAYESVKVTAKVADTISAVHFQDGEAVIAGQLLVEQTDAEESALLEEAQSLTAEARRQFERIQQLMNQGAASASLLDERRQQWQTAAAREQAMYSRLKDRLITAPFDGHVGLREVSPGALLSPGDVITTLIDDSRMKLDFTIPALYLNTVAAGTQITATTPVFPNRQFSGTVRTVDSTVNPATRSITVRAVIPNLDRALVPGMLMTLELARNPRNAVVVSEASVIPRGDKTHVLVVDTSASPPVAEQREVLLGRRFPGLVEGRTGLEADETIVSHGTLKVRPGAPLIIKAVDDGTRSVAEMLQAPPASNG